jgi:hypothetical protein
MKMGYEPIFIYIDEEGLSPMTYSGMKHNLATVQEFFRYNEEGYLTEEDDDLVIALASKYAYQHDLYYYHKDGTISPFKGWYIREKNKWCNKNYIKK